MKRSEIAAKTLEVGQAVNELRMLLIESRMVFLAGVVRAAEEALLIANTTLSDTTIPESEL